LTVEVNGVKLPLKKFPNELIETTLLGMFESLHGGENIKTLKVKLYRASKNTDWLPLYTLF
jgi:hypothetical protein